MIRLKVLMPILLVALIVVSCATAPPPEPSKEAKKEIVARESPTRETSPPVTSLDKVVIGVLDFEMSDTSTLYEGLPEQWRKGLMGDLERDTRVKLVDIDESCSLSDLKRHGYLRGEWFKKHYQLDMILHVHVVVSTYALRFYFSLIDLSVKKTREISIEITRAIPVEPQFRGVSRKILVSQDLDRVLEAKTAGLPKR